MNYASIGSISTGTCKPEDLLEVFWNELHHPPILQVAARLGYMKEV